MAPHHEPFKGLAPVKWEAVAQEDPKEFMKNVFADAQTIVDSIPVPAARQTGAALRLSQDLSKEWKEVKVNARDNPLAINVYKLAAKDGKGSWFARRSVHDGLTFEKWKLGLEREFAESMKVQSGPGAGAIRGIGAEKRVVHEVVEGSGKMEVFQLSAQFPGPTAPRDFVTLLLTSDFSGSAPQEGGTRPLRTFMIVSKPCVHPECAERQGYIRGQYESVEIIREIPSDKPAAITRARSSIDLSQEGAKERQAVAESMGKEAVLRAAKKAADGDGRHRGVSVDSAPARDDAGHTGESFEEEGSRAIEWLMVTRSDPGGNVPRFLIDRGTPGGIIGDAGKFIKWMTAKSADDFTTSDTEQEKVKEGAKQAEGNKDASPVEVAKQPTSNLLPEPSAQTRDESVPAATAYTASFPGHSGWLAQFRIPDGYALPGIFQAPSTNGSIAEEEEEDDTNESDTSSIRSFASAVEKTDEGEAATPPEITQPDTLSLHSSGSGGGSLQGSKAPLHHERELRKLQERRQKMQDKINKMQGRMSSKRDQDSQKEAANLAKLREKHDKEMAKQEEKYRRDLQRLEQRREQEQRKAEEKRRKQAEKEEKSNLALELEHVKTERDVALKEIDILKEQIGQLQSQNTMLVVKLGKMGGIKRQDSSLSVPGEKVTQTVSN
ncbi:LOW QUALITY PROTEIN: reticulocyte-binding protein 2 like protein A [Colletotrichum tofieldiae]|nr:LOW QUALITY PROTEIN: reticulocyte-binding protein 2 like protein A [Colletotrichum tofieldiae]